MELGLVLSSEPIERIAADVAVVSFFENDRPLRGSVGRVDWRLCGRLSALMREGKLTGEAGEATLVPGSGGVRAGLVLALGLGDANAFGHESCRASAREGVERSLKLGAQRVALALADPRDGLNLADRLTALVDGAAEALVGAAAGSADPESARGIELEIVTRSEEGPGAAEWLRAAHGRRLAGAVELRVDGEALRKRTLIPAGKASTTTAGMVK